MNFYQKCKKYQKKDLNKYFNITANKKEIKKILNKKHLNERDFLILLSPAASIFLEQMAQQAHQLTVQHFGRVMLLYVPLYISNYCESSCKYCGFNIEHDIKRKKLLPHEVRREAEVLKEKGFEHILLLTGCSRQKTPVSFIKKCVLEIRDLFSSTSLEVYSLKEKEYEKLIAAGVDGLTIYQEVYNREKYKKVHPAGPKNNYQFRLKAPERACRAGMRTVNIGALFGLDDWRNEAFLAGLHASYLQKKYPETSINISIPRLKDHIGNYQSENIVNDQQLVQIILAYRLFLPRVGINLSTREGAKLRDNLLPLGITKLSAESSTEVGGYSFSNQQKSEKQFEISDNRSLKNVKKMLKSKGYQPVMKDWHQNII